MYYKTLSYERLFRNVTKDILIKNLCIIVECIKVQKNITSEEFYKKIGQNVAKYRKEAGLSQLELSLAMGYKSISIVSSAEIYYKRKHFNLEHLLKISQILDIELCKLLEME